MTVSPHDANTPAGGNTPGARLAQARDDLRLTREEVAARLHLSSRQIQAIDEDNYAELPGPTYVRGYLKSYALLVGLAPEPVLEAYTRRITQPITPDFSAIAPAREITSQHHQVRFVTYIVAAIVIGLAFAWWQGREAETPHPLLEAPLEQPAASGHGTPGPANGSGALAPETESTTVAGAVTAPAAPAVPVVPAVVPAAPPAAAVARAPAPAIPAASTVPLASPAPGTEPVPALPAGPRVRLVLVFDQDSWVDIRDARQVKLLYENVPAGRSVPLEGVAPLSVFLGNAAGVRIEFNGQNVDIARYRRGLVARFTLDEAAMPAATP